MQQSTLLDDLPLTPFHFKITALTFGAHLTDGYVLGMIGFALMQIAPQMQLTPFQEGMIGSSALIGLFAGSLLLGWLADVVGRQKIFCLSFVIITLASAMQFFVHSPEALFLARVALGFGLGGDFAVGHTLLAELAPRKHRGVLLGAFSVLWTAGYAAAGFIGHAGTGMAPDAWRWLLASSALPALIILLLRLGTPESPRWLMRKGRTAEALQMVRRYFGPQVTLEAEPVAASHGPLILFSARYRRRTAFNALFYVCLVIPWFAIYTFLPMILLAMGADGEARTDLWLNGLLLMGAIVGIALTALCSRRSFLIASFLLLAVCLLAMSLLAGSLSGWLISFFALFTLTISAVSNLVGVFPAESFPTEVRSMGIGFVTAISRLGSAAGTMLLPVSMAHLGLSLTMALLAAVLLAGALVSIAWAPETKGLHLVDAARRAAEE